MWQTASDDTDDFEELQNSGAEKPNPPDNFLGGLLSGLRQGRPLTYHEGVCLESPLRSLLPGLGEQLIPAVPSWDVLFNRTRCPSRRVGGRRCFIGCEGLRQTLQYRRLSGGFC
jgi:hypothetical protein